MLLETCAGCIRREYREMPGLRLTFAQACRLWQLDALTCQTLLDQMTQEGFLCKTANGVYVAASAAIGRQAKARLRERVPMPRSA